MNVSIAPADVSEALSGRQKSEIEYHADYAARHQGLAQEAVNLDVCVANNRRWWNAYWSLYDLIRTADLHGRRVLVPGCGFGEDCIRLAQFGAEVHGFDISPEIIEIARARADILVPGRVTLATMPCERLTYPADHFDVIVLVNILHHVDIPSTMAEIRRVAKPGAEILGLEMFTHSAVQRLRNGRFFAETVYPRVMRHIYRGQPYITPDERKINETELADITKGLQNRGFDYFSILAERFFSGELAGLSKLDRLLARILGPLGRFFAGRVIFAGTLTK